MSRQVRSEVLGSESVESRNIQTFRGKSVSPQKFASSLTFLVFLSLSILMTASPAVASATNVYIAQTAAGAANGADCADAYAYSFFNSSANWGSGAAQIGPGTTVHICGTFSMPAGASGTLTIQGSGTSGDLIRIQFETGANASAPYWGPGGFITESGQSYIVVDGSPTSTPCGYVNSQDVPCNGEIQATANGASLASQQANSHGVQLNGGNNIEVRDLNCQNLFVPVQNNSNNETTNGVNNSACVWWVSSGSGGGNINVHNIEVNNSFNGVLLAYEGSNAGVHVDDSWMTNIEVGAQVGAGNGGASISSGSINGNDFSNMGNWDTSNSCGGNCPNHHEFIHLYTQQSGATISSFSIAGNYFHGTIGYSATSEIYVECDGGSLCTAPTSINVNEYNNVIVNEDPNADISTGAGGNTMTECEGSTCQIYNNTYYSPANYSSLNCAMHLEAGSVITVENNIFDGMNCAIDNGGGTVASSSNLGFGLAVACGSACSVSGDPQLSLSSSPEYQLSGSSSAAYQTGTNLTTLGISGLDVDHLGISRPSTGNWDMGAFEYSGDPPSQPNPPGNLQAVPH